jgi:hypothetical protein
MGRNILVVGQQKTGTTGVYSLIKSALLPLRNEYFFSFEPSRGLPLQRVKEQDPALSILTKIMYKNIDNFELDMFDRRVMTVRDPRDTIVSTLLFKPLLKNIADAVPMSEHQKFIEALQKKERDPRAVSILELMEVADQVGYRKHRPRRLGADYTAMMDIADEQRIHIVRYEDFVDGNVAPLSNYLQLPLNPASSETPSWLMHISRSRGHGAWRDWFTPEDVEHYRPLLRGSMSRMGYADEWELSTAPVIAAATSSAYVADRIEKRRRELAVAASTNDEGMSDGRSIATLHSMASDGNAKAALSLAHRLNAEGDFGQRWPTSARYWARQAELQGLKGATELRGQLDSEMPAAEALQDARR